MIDVGFLKHLLREQVEPYINNYSIVYSHMKGLGMLAMILVVIGGLNWGLVGFFNYNLVSTIFGSGTLTNIIYDLVGLSALYLLFTWKKM